MRPSLALVLLVVAAALHAVQSRHHPHPPPPPPPPPPTPFKCLTNVSCSLNGLCDTATGACSCDPAWSGEKCTTLNVLPAEKESGLRMFDVAPIPPGGPPNGTIAGNTSTWGGATLYDPLHKRWFMWATELQGHCGMHTWTTNSQTIRASSATANGSYTREDVQFPIWSHEVDVVRAPSSGQYVAYFSRMPTGKAPACTVCTDGSTSPSCKKMAAAAPPVVGQPEIEVSPPTYMSYSLTKDPRGAWSEPTLVLMAKPMMDINTAPVILADGSVIGMWRDHNGSPKNKYSTPHGFTASNWSDPASYKWSSAALFSDKVVTGGIEDMFLWTDKRGGFHCLFHLMYGCGTCGSHAFSTDGLHWTYTGVAYTSATKFTDGTETTFGYCERPHLVFDADGVTPVALTNGVKMGPMPGMQNDDQSYTLLRPLKQ